MYCASAVRLIVSGEDCRLHNDFLLLVLCKMNGYLSDEDVVEENFEYDGCPYSFEPEFTDEELIERRTRRQRSREYCAGAEASVLLL